MTDINNHQELSNHVELNNHVDLNNHVELGPFGGIVSTVTDIFFDSNIITTFSEAVDPLTVTNVGNGSGSYELFNETAVAWVSGVLSTADNIQYTFNPTSDFTIGDQLTLHLTSAIETEVGANPYAGPFEFKYLVVNRLPTFSVQPSLSFALYDGGAFNYTTSDADGDNVDEQVWNGLAWVTVNSDISAGARAALEVTGLSAGTINYIKFRVANTGLTSWTESDLVAPFNTVSPNFVSVISGDEKNTLVFADHINDTADSFDVHWGTETGVLSNTIIGVTPPYAHTNLTNDTEYFYEIVAIKGTIESLSSTEKSGTPTAAVAGPAIDTLVTSGGDTLTITFDAAGLDSVNLYHSQTSPVTTGDTKITGITSPYDLTGLTKGEGYFLALEGVISAVPTALGTEDEGWTNEMISSEDLSNASAWIPSHITITANESVAPDGTMTADMLTDAAIGDLGRVGQEFTLVAGDESQERTYSVFIKQHTSGDRTSFEGYYLTGGTLIFNRLVFDWAGGIPTINVGESINPGNATLIDDGDGWWRTSTSVTNNNSGNTKFLARLYATGIPNPEQGSARYWGVQVVKGSVAGKYTKRGAV